MSSPERVEDFKRGEFALRFDSYEALDSAAHILEHFDEHVSLWLELADDLVDNGRWLGEKSPDKIEGRIRELIGLEIRQYAQALVSHARRDPLSARLSTLEGMVKRVRNLVGDEQSA